MASPVSGSTASTCSHTPTGAPDGCRQGAGGRWNSDWGLLIGMLLQGWAGAGAARRRKLTPRSVVSRDAARAELAADAVDVQVDGAAAGVYVKVLRSALSTPVGGRHQAERERCEGPAQARVCVGPSCVRSYLP
ncbi:hypothetical protein GCM10022403_045800 [Streptomyces coacervatus]|uniref:Uncharacterized protein n=1 Tax=Streptomyces coacervatus TaxID=647381 RepID=A0ABP7I0K2_9ACTN